MNSRIRNLLLAVAVCLVVMVPATIEDWYGRTFYADDAISYLDVSHAIDHGDWHDALNPYWSIGYPFLLSATRCLSPEGRLGEWTGIHVLNLLAFIGIYLSFLYFLRTAVVYASRVGGNEGKNPDAAGGWNGFLFVIGTAIFLLWEIKIGNVSRVSPDPLISGLFFLVAARALKFYLRPAPREAVILGLLMGIGYIMKAVFLPISFGVLVVMSLQALTRPAPARLSTISRLAWAIPALALVSLPYVLALSHAVGTFTLGQSGSLNYAWNVNHMPRSVDWEGGPEPFGRPVHPTHLVMTNPPVFTFAEPFHVTYPPWFNPPYWFDGYHHFFSPKNQAHALLTNAGVFRRLFFEGGHVVAQMAAAALVFGVCLFLWKQRDLWWKRLASLWPLFLLPVAAISVYLPVVLEPRYVAGFLIVLLVTPLLPIFVPTLLVSPRTASGIALLMALACAFLLIRDMLPVLSRMTHGQSFATDEAWNIGIALPSYGVMPGDKVASVGDRSGIDCTWAYVGGVRIVGEIGNDAYDLENQETDYAHFAHDPNVQQAVFDQFRGVGARLVLVRDQKDAPAGPGWTQVPGTKSWVHLL